MILLLNHLRTIFVKYNIIHTKKYGQHDLYYLVINQNNFSYYLLVREDNRANMGWGPHISTSPHLVHYSIPTSILPYRAITQTRPDNPELVKISKIIKIVFIISTQWNCVATTMPHVKDLSNTLTFQSWIALDCQSTLFHNFYKLFTLL